MSLMRESSRCVHLLNNLQALAGVGSSQNTFRLEGTPAFCIVSYILSIGVGQGAMRDKFPDVQNIFDLNIPADRDVLRVE
jgi:hypothetical protein